MILNRFRNTMLAVAMAIVASVAILPTVAEAVTYSGAYYSTPIKKATYSATALALVPAASATDILTIKGSATKTVYVTNLSCSGTSTAAGTLPVSVIKRSTANSAGTSTAPAAIALDSTNAAATAVVAAYTANPTVGTSVGAIASGLLGTNVVAGVPAPALTFMFDRTEAQYATLRGVAQSISLNAGGASFTAGASLTCSVDWIEL